MNEKLTRAEYEGLIDCFDVVRGLSTEGSTLERIAANQILKKLSKRGEGRYYEFIDKLQDITEKT